MTDRGLAAENRGVCVDNDIVLNVGMTLKALYQSAGTVFGFKILCVLVPAVFILGSWAAFRFVWNITPEVREKMKALKAEQKAIG